MAKVRKRGSRWQLDYFDPHGKRIRLSFAKKKKQKPNLPSVFLLLLGIGIWMLRRTIKIHSVNYAKNI